MARISSVPEFRRRLSTATLGVRALVLAEPDPHFRSILSQLEALESWTREGMPPGPDEKARLSFGLLASLHLDALDPRLAAELYELATWVTHW